MTASDWVNLGNQAVDEKRETDALACYQRAAALGDPLGLTNLGWCLEAGIGVPIYGTTRGGFNRPYPCVSAGCGAIDMTGHAQVPARYSAVIWGQCRKPCIAMRPVDHDGEKYFFGNWRGTDAVESFSWPGMEGKRAEIEVYAIGSQVELWQDGRWLGLDPTNNRPVDETYIKLTHGRDFGDGTIDRGRFLGFAGQSQKVRVSVEEIL